MLKYYFVVMQTLYKFALFVKETATNHQKCGQLLNKILTCYSRWCSIKSSDMFTIYCGFIFSSYILGD